jgi:hypothetical protein
MSGKLSKLRPTLIVLAVLVISAVLGYVWGASAVDIVDTGIWQLQMSYQGIYIQSVADAYALDANDALALERLSFVCQQDTQKLQLSTGAEIEGNSLNLAFASAEDRYGSDPTKKANLDQLSTLVTSGLATQNDQVQVCNTKSITPGTRAGRLIGPVVLVLMGVAGVGYAIRTYIQSEEESAAPVSTVKAAPVPGTLTAAPAPSTSAETVQRPRAALPSIPGLGKKKAEEPKEPRSAAAAGARLSQAAEKTDYTAIGQDTPLVQFMTTYLHGDDLYDDSFSIETPSGEFLGETGVGVSETLNAGSDAKNVTALEVWLFDKNDIRTVTKVLMSDHAFNDDAIRARLAPKGDAVQIKINDQFALETATLRVQCRIVDLAYKSAAMPPNSVLERITIELAAWKRETGAGRPGGPPSGGGLPGVGGGTPPTGLPSFPRGSGS